MTVRCKAVKPTRQTPRMILLSTTMACSRDATHTIPL